MTTPLNLRKSNHSATPNDCVEVAPFHKSTYSNPNNCVEVSDCSCGAAVRDSKHPELGHLLFPSGEWTALLKASL